VIPILLDAVSKNSLWYGGRRRVLYVLAYVTTMYGAVVDSPWTSNAASSQIGPKKAISDSPGTESFQGRRRSAHYECLSCA